MAAIFPFFTSWYRKSACSLNTSRFGIPVSSLGIPKSMRVFPSCFNSWLTASEAFPGATAKETSVGGTWRSLNVPLMESLPPMAPRPRAACIWNAPRRAAAGFPQLVLSVSFSKYSWSVRYALRQSAPIATRRVTERRTAYTAPWKGLHSARSGSKPCAMKLALSVWPRRTGNLAAIPSAGVFWYLPPKGIRTVPAPTVESKRSASPCWDALFRSPMASNHIARISLISGRTKKPSSSGLAIYTSFLWDAPFVLRKAREISTILSPRQVMTSRPLSFTSAMTVASRFSSAA